MNKGVPKNEVTPQARRAGLSKRRATGLATAKSTTGSDYLRVLKGNGGTTTAIVEIVY